MATLTHPTDMALLDEAAGRGSVATMSHVDGCERCRHRVARLRGVVRAVRATVEREKELAPAAPSSMRTKTRELLGHADRGWGLAETLVKAAGDGDEELLLALEEMKDDPALSLGLLYSCQMGASLAAHVPARAMALADVASTFPTSGGEGAASWPSFDLLKAEASLLRSQAVLNLGRAEEAKELAVTARSLFLKAEARGFARARADYFVASAEIYLKNYDEALELLGDASSAFADFRQPHWVGRAKAAMGLAMMRRNNDPEALALFSTAEKLLDPALDSVGYGAALLNRASLLLALERREEARSALLASLEHATAHRIRTHALAARFNLAELSLMEGRLAEALQAFEAVAGQDREEGNRIGLVVDTLYVAECQFRLGRERDARISLSELRAHRAEAGEEERPAFDDLLAGLDHGGADIVLVAHVRRFFRALAQGEAASYSRLYAA